MTQTSGVILKFKCPNSYHAQFIEAIGQAQEASRRLYTNLGIPQPKKTFDTFDTQISEDTDGETLVHLKDFPTNMLVLQKIFAFANQCKTGIKVFIRDSYDRFQPEHAAIKWAKIESDKD